MGHWLGKFSLLILLGACLLLIMECESPPPPMPASITIERVQVTAQVLHVAGRATLPDGACVLTHLVVDDEAVAWWPQHCATVAGSAWSLTVPLSAPGLDPEAPYVLRAWQREAPAVTAVPFPFDLAGPPAPPTAAPSVDRDPETAIVMLLPDAAAFLDRAQVDLDGDGADELLVLAGFGGTPERLGYDMLELFVLTPAQGEDAAGGYALAWHSGPLAGDRAEPLQVRDINADGRPEALVVQAQGAAGELVQVLAWQTDAYGLLRPHGGHFEGQAYFGECGASVADVDGDGVEEILAHYGAAASHTDVYRWDGQAYSLGKGL